MSRRRGCDVPYQILKTASEVGSFRPSQKLPALSDRKYLTLRPLIAEFRVVPDLRDSSRRRNEVVFDFMVAVATCIIRRFQIRFIAISDSEWQSGLRRFRDFFEEQTGLLDLQVVTTDSV